MGTKVSGHVKQNHPAPDKIFNTSDCAGNTKIQGNSEAAIDIVKESNETGTEDNPIVKGDRYVAADENSNSSMETEEKIRRKQTISDVLQGNITMESLVSNSVNTGESSCDSSVPGDQNNIIGSKDRRYVRVTFMMKGNSNRLRMEVKSKVRLMKLMVMFGKKFGLDLDEHRFFNGDLVSEELELTGKEKVEELKTGYVRVERLYTQ